MPMLAKINALLACSQRPFVTVLLIQRKLFSYDAPKVSNFTSGGVQNRETKNRALGTIVTSIQDSKPSEKQISPTFSYFLINNALLYHFLANWLAHYKKMTEKCVFREKSWIAVTIAPSLLVLVSRFCTPPEVKFDAFGTSKHGEGKSLLKKIFATLISTLGRFNRANKKKSVIYTLTVRAFIWLFDVFSKVLFRNAVP